MDFSKEIKTLNKSIDFLRLLMDAPLDKLSQKELKKLMTALTRCVDDIYYIDDLMPLEEFAEKFDKRKDKEAFLDVLDLLDEAFGLLDEILGPEDAEGERAGFDMPAGPEDAGADADLGSAAPEEPGGIDGLYAELIKNMKPGRHTS